MKTKTFTAYIQEQYGYFIIENPSAHLSIKEWYDQVYLFDLLVEEHMNLNN